MTAGLRVGADANRGCSRRPALLAPLPSALALAVFGAILAGCDASEPGALGANPSDLSAQPRARGHAPLPVGLAGVQPAPLYLPAAGDFVQRRDLASFQEVVVTGAIDVQLRRGMRPVLILIGDHDLPGTAAGVASVASIVDNGRLTLAAPEGVKGLRAIVLLPQLSAVTVGGPSRLDIGPVPQPPSTPLTLLMGGNGRIEARGLDVDQLHLKSTSTGSIALAGRAKSMKVDLLGAGGVNADQLLADRLSISSEGAGGGRFWSDAPVDVLIGATGDVIVRGTGQCSVSRMGLGTVKCTG